MACVRIPNASRHIKCAQRNCKFVGPQEKNTIHNSPHPKSCKLIGPRRQIGKINPGARQRNQKLQPLQASSQSISLSLTHSSSRANNSSFRFRVSNSFQAQLLCLPTLQQNFTESILISGFQRTCNCLVCSFVRLIMIICVPRVFILGPFI